MRFISWIISCAIATVIIGTVTVAVQQSIRLSADDPQIQLVEDASRSLMNAEDPDQVILFGNVDPSVSLSPFVAVFDNKGVAIASSFTLDGLVPSPPVGVFDIAWEHGQHRVTWEPIDGVRVATVIERVPEKSQFVLAGRSLREVDSRISTILWLSVFGWLLCMILITLKYFVFKKDDRQSI